MCPRIVLIIIMIIIIIIIIIIKGVVNGGPAAQVWLKLAAWDDFWLAQLQAQGHVRVVQWVASAEALCARFNSSYDTVVVYDPALLASVNVAQMLASTLGRAIVCSPAQAPVVGAGKRLVPLGQPPYVWGTAAAAYAWALEQLYPRLASRLLAYVHPTQPIPHHLRDYLLQHGVFTFFATSDAQELAVAERVLQTVPANTPVLGFWGSNPTSGLDEYTGVGLAGSYGVLTVVCDWATNLSLLSGVLVNLTAVIGAYRARLAPPAPLPPRPDPTKVYLSMHVVESGDSPSYWLTRQYQVWNATLTRPPLPIAWGMVGLPDSFMNEQKRKKIRKEKRETGERVTGK